MSVGDLGQEWSRLLDVVKSHILILIRIKNEDNDDLLEGRYPAWDQPEGLRRKSTFMVLLFPSS